MLQGEGDNRTDDGPYAIREKGRASGKRSIEAKYRGLVRSGKRIGLPRGYLRDQSR